MQQLVVCLIMPKSFARGGFALHKLLGTVGEHRVPDSTSLTSNSAKLGCKRKSVTLQKV